MLINRLAASLVAAMLAGSVASAQAQEITVVSFGGSYQDGQSKALFQPAAKAMGIKVKEETYTGIGDLRLKMKAGANTWDVVASGSGSAARAGAEGLLEKLDYKVIDASSFLPGLARRVLRGRRRVLDGARVEHQDLRRQGAAELGRLLGRQEIPGQALVPQGCRRRARARADGRRRAAGQGLRGAVAAGRHRARDQEDQGAEAAHRRLVVVGRAARAAHEGRRGRHGHRLERPLRRGRQGRRQGRLHVQPGAARLRLLRDPQGRAEQGRGDEVPGRDQQAAVPGRVHQVHHLRSDQQEGLRPRHDRRRLREAPAVVSGQRGEAAARSISTGTSRTRRGRPSCTRTC